MTSIVFMGTPDFAVPSLETLIATQTVVGVITQPDRPAGRGKRLRPSPVKVVAEAAGLPVYQPGSLKSAEAAAPLRAWQPELIVVAAFGQILRPHVLELPRHGCLNVHASLLPRWRGASPIQHAIMAGDEATGICLMQMDVGLDTGPVYVCEATPITATDTAVTVHDRLAHVGADLLARHLDEIVRGERAAVPQQAGDSTYAPLIGKEDGRLDFTRTGVELDRQIRALTPWPGTFTTWEGETVKIKQAQLAPGRQTNTSPGQIWQQDEALLVQTADSSLQLLEIQLAGKRAMSAAAFVRGRPDFIGSHLGS